MITISIDCAPGSTRPGSYFKFIVNEISNSTLSQDAKDYIKDYINKEKECASFGEWIWKLEEPNKNGVRTDIIDFFRASLTQYYNQGAIRYASFS
jgi:hypothetical protein